jgi:hypothetical protein
MFFRSTKQDHDGHDNAAGGTRSKLDVAIIASVLAMGTLNLMVMTDQFGATKAYAAESCSKPVVSAPLA